MDRATTHRTALGFGTIAVLLAALVAAIQTRRGSSPGADASGPGRSAFARHGCAACHTIGDRTRARLPLDNVTTRLDRPALRAAIVAKAGPHGPRYATLAASEVDALIAFLESTSNRP